MTKSDQDRVKEFRDKLYQYSDADFYYDNGSINMTSVINHVAQQFKEVREGCENRTNLLLTANRETHKESLKQQRQEIVDMIDDNELAYPQIEGATTGYKIGFTQARAFYADEIFQKLKEMK